MMKRFYVTQNGFISHTRCHEDDVECVPAVFADEMLETLKWVLNEMPINCDFEHIDNALRGDHRHSGGRS